LFGSVMTKNWELVIGLFLVGIGAGLLVTGFSYAVEALAVGVGQGDYFYTGLPLMYTGTFLFAIGLAIIGLGMASTKRP
jgi:hypothetical protein